MSLNRKGRVWKDVPSRLVTTECQLSGLTTPMTETGGMENVSESQEANWEEMSGWFWGTKKLRWKGWKKKRNPFILHSQESRGGRTDTLLACWTLSLYACKHVWKKQLNSLQTSTKHFFFMRTVIKFQFNHFFKLLTFSTEAGVEELIHQSEAPRIHQLHVDMSLDKTVTPPLLMCRCVCVMSPRGLWGEVAKVSSDCSCLSVGSENGNLFPQVLTRHLGCGPSNRYQQLW